MSCPDLMASRAQPDVIIRISSPLIRQSELYYRSEVLFGEDGNGRICVPALSYYMESHV